MHTSTRVFRRTLVGSHIDMGITNRAAKVIDSDSMMPKTLIRIEKAQHVVSSPSKSQERACVNDIKPHFMQACHGVKVIKHITTCRQYQTRQRSHHDKRSESHVSRGARSWGVLLDVLLHARIPKCDIILIATVGGVRITTVSHGRLSG